MKARQPQLVLNTKADEIEALSAFVQRLPADSYLNHLFTPDMVGWVSNEILGDGMPNLYAYYADGIHMIGVLQKALLDSERNLHRTEEVRDSYRNDLAEIQGQRDTLRIEKNSLINRCNKLEAERDYAIEQRDTVESNLDAANLELEALRAELKEVQGERNTLMRTLSIFTGDKPQASGLVGDPS